MEIINTHNAPKAIGPYSQAIRHGEFIFISGQIGLSPENGLLSGNDTKAQCLQMFKNIEAILEAAGSSKHAVLKTTLFLQDLQDFEEVNALYAEFFGAHKPARSTIEVSKLPKNAKVEMELIATSSEKV